MEKPSASRFLWLPTNTRGSILEKRRPRNSELGADTETRNFLTAEGLIPAYPRGKAYLWWLRVVRQSIVLKVSL
jgi:hypothetical protein